MELGRRGGRHRPRDTARVPPHERRVADEGRRPGALDRDANGVAHSQMLHEVLGHVFDDQHVEVADRLAEMYERPFAEVVDSASQTRPTYGRPSTRSKPKRALDLDFS